MKGTNNTVNPIQYFLDLIFYKHLSKKKEMFAKGDEYDHHFSYDYDTETRTYNEHDPETGEWTEWKETFKKKIDKEVNKELKLSLKAIDALLFTDTFDKKSELVSSIIDELNFLIKILENYSDADKYTKIEESIRYIKKYIKLKHSRLITPKNEYSSAEKELLKLIRDNTETEKEREELITRLTTIQSLEVTAEEKKKSGGILRKFLDSIASESGKKIVQELTENGADFIEYII